MPATCPDASTPASVLPSTRPAFSSIGVLAAMTTCDQVSSLPCRISRPSLIIDRQRHLRHLLELLRVAHRRTETAQPRTAFELLHQPGAQHAVRHAVDAGRHHGAVEAGLQISLLDGVRHGGVRRQQEAGAHRDTRGAVGQRGGQPAAVEESAGGHHRDVDRVEHRRQQQRGGDRSGVAAALAALHDHRVGAPAGDLLGVLGQRRPTESPRRRPL